MRTISLGTGVYGDLTHLNNSHLVITKGARILLDCGPTVPLQLWRVSRDPDFVDVIYISHRHDDHCLGLRPLIRSFWDNGRIKPITIYCPKQEQEYIFTNIIGWMYKENEEHPRAHIFLLDVGSGSIEEFKGLKLSFMPTNHTKVTNLAVRIENHKHTVCYSGDGKVLQEKFYRGASLLIHETLCYKDPKEGHACIQEVIRLAEDQSVKKLMLTHLDMKFRKHELPKLIRDGAIKSDRVEIIIPKPFHQCRL